MRFFRVLTLMFWGVTLGALYHPDNVPCLRCGYTPEARP